MKNIVIYCVHVGNYVIYMQQSPWWKASKLIVCPLAKKFPASEGPGVFITIYTTASLLFLFNVFHPEVL